MLYHVTGGMNFERCGANDADANDGERRLFAEEEMEEGHPESEKNSISLVGLSSQPIDVQDAAYQQCTSNLSIDEDEVGETKCAPTCRDANVQADRRTDVLLSLSPEPSVVSASCLPLFIQFEYQCNETNMTTSAASPAAASAAVVFPWLLRPAPPLDIIGSGQRKQMAHALRPVPPNLHPCLPLLTDTHAHMAGYGQEARDSFARDTRQNGARIPGLHATEYVVVSVDPSDWKYCDEDTCPKPTASGAVRPALGIHPQCADDIDNPDPSPSEDSWLSHLRTCLEASPWSIVGECGLDNNGPYRHAFESHQMPIFRHHLRLAAELNRPISVHSVKADGALVDILIEEVDMGHKLPPTVCLHSFSGSIETLKRIVNIVEGRPRNKKERLRRDSSSHSNEDNVRVFVGFNAWTNLYKKQASRLVNGLANDIPMGQSRLLIESDWNPIDFDFEGSDRRDSDKILMNGLNDLSDILGWEPECTAKVLADNTVRFLNPVECLY